MSKPVFLNSKVVYHDNSREYNIDARGRDLSEIMRAINAEDITPAEDSSVSSDYQSDSPSSIDSFIFTKKAKNEGKIDTIIQSLQKSVQGRKDKTRAFVQELHGWQDDGYVDAHYNARVMYDELERLIPIPFGYDVFRRLYNSSRC